MTQLNHDGGRTKLSASTLRRGFLTSAAAGAAVLAIAACGSSSSSSATSASTSPSASSTGVAAAAASTSGTVTVTIEPVLKTQKVQTIKLPAPPAGTDIGFNHPILADPGAASVAAGAQLAAKQTGVGIKVTDANLNVSRQLQSGMDMLNDGDKGILTIELVPHSLDAMYNLAKSKKAATVTEYGSTTGSVGEDPSEPAADAVALIEKDYPQGATGVMLSDTPSPVINAREAAFQKDVAASGGKVKVIEVQHNLSETTAGAQTIAANILQAHPDIDFIWGINDTSAIGAGLAAKQAGKKLLITGMNGSPAGIAAIKQGLFQVTWDANQNAQGELMLVHALQYIETGKYPASVKNGFTEITSANVNDWIPYTQRAKGAS
jgi:ribose transport system substrate-binding protein